MRKRMLVMLWMVFFGMTPVVQEADAEQLSGRERAILRELERQSGGGFRIEWNRETGTPAFLSGTLTAPSNHSPQWIAYEMWEKIKPLYGMKHPRQELRIVNMDRDPTGFIRVEMEHLLFKTPVWGDRLLLQIDRQGVVRQVSGRFFPGLEKKLFGRPLQPALSRQAAANKAFAAAPKWADRQQSRVDTYYLPTRAGTPPVFVVSLPAVQPATGVWKAMVHGLTGRIIEQWHEPDSNQVTQVYISRADKN